MLRTRRAVLAWGGVALATLTQGVAGLAAAGSLAKPLGGQIILTIDGAITNSNGDTGAFFDLALLKTLPAQQIVTETPWTKGLHTFTGVPLGTLMEWVGATGKTVTASALNDYSVDLPIYDGGKPGPLLVYLFDGAPMLPSDRGPLWIVYPFSEHPELQTETYYQRAVWNLYGMTVH